MGNEGIELKVLDQQTVELQVVQGSTMQLGVGVEIVERTVEEYSGSYVFTPNENEQTVEIKDKKATDNITVEAVPENYARMVWTGNIVTFY